MGPFGVAMEYGGEYFENEVKTVLGGVNSDGKSSIAGGFSQTTLTYGIFDVIGGLRYDHFTLEGRGTVPGGTIPRCRHRCPWVRSRSISPRDGSIPS